MATSYSTLLGLALPVQGELSGTWGDAVNDYITEYLDSAIAGVQTISGTQTSVALSQTNGATLVSAGAGATGSSQYMVINCTGTPASLLTISAPNTSKVYVVINATAQSVKLVGVTGPTAGVTLVTGEKAVCAWNGSDFVKVATSVADGVTSVAMTVPSLLSVSGSPITSTGTLALTYSGTALPVANGGTGLTAGTSGGLLAYTAAGTLASSTAVTQYGVIYSGGAGAVPVATANGTTGQAFIATTSGAPSWGTLPVAGGGTGAATLTANNVLLGNGTSALQVIAPSTSGNVLTSNGSTWASTAPVAAAPSFPYAARTSNTILTATEKSYFIEVTGASTFTQTLTAAATLGNGWFVWLRNAGTGVVTVDPNGSETIGGTTTAALNPGDYWLIVCNGTNFTLARIDGTNSQTYSTGTGNFTAPSGVYRVHARIWGAGGGSRDGSLAGGGGGGFSEGYLATTPGGTLAYAVGAGVSNGTGGSTTLSTMTATGGSTSGGAGGTATGGSLLNVSGGTGARNGGASAVGIAGGAFGTPSLAVNSGRVFGLVPGGGSQTFQGIDTGIAGANGAIIITWV